MDLKRGHPRIRAWEESRNWFEKKEMREIMGGKRKMENVIKEYRNNKVFIERNKTINQ